MTPNGPTQIPESFWRRDVVKQALKQRDMGTIFALLKGYGITQGQICQATGIDQPKLSRYKSGLQKVVRLEQFERIADGLHFPDQVRISLGLAPRESTVKESSQRSAVASLGGVGSEDREVSETYRRELLVTTLGLGPAMVSKLASGPDTARITMPEAQALRKLAEEITSTDKIQGGDKLARLTTDITVKAENWLNYGEYSYETGQELQLGIAQLASRTGWVNYDAGNQRKARYWYQQALHHAQLAGDIELEVGIYSTMSMQSAFVGRARESVQLAKRGQSQGAGTISSRFSSLISLREAAGWARQGNVREVKRVASLARKIYRPEGAENDPHWVRFFTPAELGGLEAAAFMWVGELGLAETKVLEAITLLDKEHVRNNIYWATLLAEIRAQRGDFSGAADQLRENVLPIAARITSTRTRQQIQRTCGLLRESGAYEGKEIYDQARAFGLYGVVDD